MKTYTIRVTYTATKSVEVVADSLDDAITKAKSETEDMDKNLLYHRYDHAEQTAAPRDIPDDLDPMIEQVKDLMHEAGKEFFYEISGVYQRKTKSTYDDEITIECCVDYIYLEHGELQVAYDQDQWEDDEPLTELDYNVQHAILKQAIESLTD